MSSSSRLSGFVMLSRTSSAARSSRIAAASVEAAGFEPLGLLRLFDPCLLAFVRRLLAGGQDFGSLF